LDDHDRLAAVLRDAELTGIEVDEHPVALRTRDFDEWWARTTALAGPVAGLLASLDEDVATALHERLQKATAQYETPTGLELPGVTLLGSARR
jgi:hypothetical protein